MLERAESISLERVVLRRARTDDVEALYAIMSDAETMRYWSTSPHSTLAVTAAWLDKMVSADPHSSDEFIIELDGSAIGKVGAWRLPELGILLDRRFWGQGLAREALLGFIGYIRARGVMLLTADVDPLNGSCLNLLEAVGFRKIGFERATFVIGGRVADSVYLSFDLTPR